MRKEVLSSKEKIKKPSQQERFSLHFISGGLQYESYTYVVSVSLWYCWIMAIQITPRPKFEDIISLNVENVNSNRYIKQFIL